MALRARCMGNMVAAGRYAPLKLGRALERGENVAVLVDQHATQGVDVVFFGRWAKANPLVAQLARLTGAPIRGQTLMPGVIYAKQVEFTAHGPVVLNVVSTPRPTGLYSIKALLSNGAVALPVLREQVAVGAVAGSGLMTASGLPGGEVSPAVLLSLLNHQLYESTPMEKYATLFLGFYDSQSRRITYSNGGHLPPIIIGEHGALRRLDQGGTVVGLFDRQLGRQPHVRGANGRGRRSNLAR